MNLGNKMTDIGRDDFASRTCRENPLACEDEEARHQLTLEALKDVAEGRMISHEDIKARFGLRARRSRRL